jgi:cell division protein FtsI (penicillin-binding protein 3)
VAEVIGTMIQKVFNHRTLALGLLVSIGGLMLIVRLATLHFSSKIPTLPSPDRHEYVRRGLVKDMKGSILAMSLECRSLYVNPSEIENSEDTAAKLASALGLNADAVLRRITRQERRFVWVKRKLTESEVSRVAAYDLKGIHFKKEYIRAYPHGSLGANLIGFVNADNEGIEGIEYKYDEVLTSYDDYILASDKGDFRSGNSVVLTIDRVIQYAAENAVARAVKDSGAKQGVVIITEVKTGRVLALAKYPTYDLNNYSRSTEAERGFFTVSEPFEPGSTMKIFAAAAILANKPSIANEKFICHGGVDIGDAHINCTGVHGVVNLADSIKYSCNVGVISAIKGVNSSAWYSMMRAFGFGEKTGSEVAGESSGVLRSVKDWSGLSKYSMAIGQEVSVTSLQLAAAYSAIANDGVYNSPYIVESVLNSRGEEIVKKSHTPKGRVVSVDIARELKKMLVRVVDGGTGKKAAIPYYHVAGKTGTAQKSVKGVYSHDKNISSFAGIVPVEDPDVCILIVIDEPQGVTAGSLIAAPVFADVAERVLTVRGVALSPAKSYALQQTRRTDYVYTGGGVPDFRNRTLADAVKILAAVEEKIPIHISVEGSGSVYGQKPDPGTPLAPDDTITLLLRGSDE